MSDAPAYLDASAAVKLVVPEAESRALLDLVDGIGVLVASEVLEVELHCAARRRRSDGALRHRARATLEGIELIRFSAAVRERASQPFEPPQRALDAVHLATALSLALPDLVFVSYDAQQLEAARTLGLACVSPA